MRPSTRASESAIRRLLLALFMGLVVAAMILPAAQAQETETAAAPDPEADDGSRFGGFSLPGLAQDDPAVVPEEELPAPEPDPTVDPEATPEPEPTVDPEATPEPVVREIVDDGDRSIQIIEHDASGYPDVDVVVSVPPALAGNLERGSFSLTEDGRVRSLDVVKLRDVIEVIVVIDTSGSMAGDPIDAATAAAKDFVRSLDAETRVAVVGFGATAQTKAGFDSSRAELATAIDRLTAAGETTLYDALVLASSEFEGNARRFVVVLSDGKDTASQATLDDAGAALQAADVNMYAITLQSADADFGDLETLAAQVDGRVVAATDTASLSATYASIASRLANQYRLSYTSAKTGEVAVAIAVDANGILAVAADKLQLSRPDPVAVAEESTSGGTPPTVNIDTSNPSVTPAGSAGGLAGNANAIYIGAGALFVAVAMGIFLAMSTEPKGPSAFERLNFTPGAKRGGLSQIADRASGMADRLLEKQERRGALDSQLERAGLDMRPGEYLIAVIGGALGLGAVGFIMLPPLFAVGVFVGTLIFGRLYVNFKASKRQKMFGNQLGDTLMMIAGSIRAGHGVVEAIDTVASQADSPTGDEFSRAVAESRIGRDMVESLYDIADRTASEDFIWVVRAIGINRELGGDLAEILDNVGETIRDRNRLRDQVKALSAEGKVSALILFALPIVVGAWVKMSNPEYLDAMTSEPAGKVLMGAAFMSLILGGIWLKKLVTVDF